MKYIYKILSISVLFIVLFLSISCDNFLTQEVYTQYDPEEFLQTRQGIKSLLHAAYSPLYNGSLLSRNYLVLMAAPTKTLWDYGGSYVNTFTLYTNFKWDPQQGILLGVWKNYYKGIRNANSLLDNIHLAKSTLSKERINEFKAEARFIRAACYYFLWQIFGPVPLVTSTESETLFPKRPTQEEFSEFMIDELKAAAEQLPVTQEKWGKATKGAALALLAQYCLNTHQNKKAAKFYRKVIDLGVYHMFRGNIKYQFAVKNERNAANIFVAPVIASQHINAYMPHAYPPKYPIKPNQRIWGTQFCIYNSFYKTYLPNDKRKSWFITEYTTPGGKHVNLLNSNSLGRAVRCFKWWPDPNAIGPSHGNDIVLIRYAHVLLGLAEALNEINGPNKESVRLLNKIRNRAGIPEYELSDFPTKESFEKAMLKERHWEFVVESTRRMDLIRNGVFIDFARKRGIDAKKYETLYPIPQKAMNTNKNLVQNPGY